MKKLALMKKFMKNFVGNSIRLVIKEKEGTFKVHTIEIMQKTDSTCPVKELALGDYFIRLGATSLQGGDDAHIVCDWSDDLLKSLLANYEEARKGEYPEITMFRDPLSGDPNKWMLSWGDSGRGEPKKDPIGYIS